MWSGVRIIRLMNDDSQRAFLSIAHASQKASHHHGLGLSLSRRMGDRTNPRTAVEEPARIPSPARFWRRFDHRVATASCRAAGNDFLCLL